MLKRSKVVLSMCLLLFLCYGTNINAQKNKDIPANLSDKIKSLYPDASDVRWEMEDSLYEASFVYRKVETSLLLSKEGKLLSTESIVASSTLPRKIKDYFAKHHVTAAITEAARIVDFSGIVTYEVEAGNIEYLFDAQGQWLRQENEDDDDEEEDDDR